MRTALAATVFAAILNVMSGGPVPAQTATIYPWCTSGASAEFGGRNCGFVTFEQCLVSARGNGQFCDQNPFYVGPKPAPKTERKQRSNPSR
jgi:hypothetical protein